MQQVTFKDVLFQNSKSICDCLIKKGMTLENAFEVVCKLIKCLEAEVDLDRVLVSKLGIDVTCKIKPNLLTVILNKLIEADANMLLEIAGLRLILNNINISLGNLRDEKVKFTAADPTPGYLEDKITTTQPGSISKLNNQFVFAGFVPIGTVFYIDKSRLGDFDTSGKGKAGTDVYGYAISNGQNTTTNRLGKFFKTVTNLLTAGSAGGANTVTLAAANIPSLSFPVTGTISDALIDDITIKTGFQTNLMNDGSGGSTLLLRHTPLGDGPYKMDVAKINIKHTHGHNLQSAYDNASPSSISTEPEYILEIPIQRINL